MVPIAISDNGRDHGASAMFWISLTFAMALLALTFAFIYSVDQFADRVKHGRYRHQRWFRASRARR